MGMNIKDWMRKNSKRIAASAAAVVIFSSAVVVMANSERLKDAFDPQKYANEQDLNKNTVAYDSTVFGSDDTADNALEMDQQAKDDYNLESGDDHIKKNDQSGEGQQISDGTGEGTTEGNGLNVTDDGTGPTVGGSATPTNNGDDTTPAGDGGDNGLTPGGSGNSPTPSPAPNPGGNDTPSSDGGNTPGGDTPRPTPTPTPDPDENKYGHDYDSPDVVESTYPDEETDKKKGVTASSLQVTGSLKQHFYIGEQPRSTEMESYIKVNAKMSDGTERTNLLYKSSDSSGGDYQVEWAADDEKIGTYTATISYRGMTQTMEYDVVDWTLSLLDFEEAAVAEPEVQVQRPGKSPQIDLQDSLNNMYQVIQDRTEENETEPGKYQYVYDTEMVEVTDEFGTPKEEEFYVKYFGGWTEKKDGDSYGAKYVMKRPTDDQVIDGVYNVQLYPKWVDAQAGNLDYQVYLQRVSTGGTAGERRWELQLMDYIGEDTTMTVPEGVNVIRMINFYRYGMEEGRDNLDKVTKIVIPASVSEIIYSSGINDAHSFPSLEAFSVSVDNQSFLDIDGILYNKTGKKLLKVPEAKTSIKKWSKTVNEIGENAFIFVKMNQIEVPDSVETLGDFSFRDGDFKTIHFQTKNQLTLGENIFHNGDNERVTVKKIQMESTKFPSCTYSPVSNMNLSLIFTQGYNTDVGALGLQIEIPDTDHNTGYLDFLRALQTDMDANCEKTGVAYQVLRTPKNVQKEYVYDEGMLLTKDKKTLLLASGAIEGDCIVPEYVETIDKDAFLSCNKIESVKLSDKVKKIADTSFANMSVLRSVVMPKVPPILGTDVFGEQVNDGLQMFVSSVDYNNYLHTYKEKLDADYEEGTTEKILASTDGDLYIHEGSQYYRNGNDTYTLVKAVPTSAEVFEPMEGTTILAEGCMDNCEAIEVLLLPKSLQSIENNAFTGCKNLKILASNAMTAPKIATQSFNGVPQNVAVYAPENSADYDTWKGVFPDLDTLTESYFYEKTQAVYGKTGDENHLLYAASDCNASFNLLDNTVEIADYAFAGNQKVQYVFNADQVSKIGESAFEGCDRLRSVITEDSKEDELIIGARASC